MDQEKTRNSNRIKCITSNYFDETKVSQT